VNLYFDKYLRCRILLLLLMIPACSVFLRAQQGQEWLDLSFAYIDGNKLDSAEYALKKYLENDPGGQLNPFVLNNLATIQRRLGKWDAALLSYTAALGTYPKNTVFLASRAALFAEMGKPANAIADYTALLAENTKDEEALYQRGLLYLQMRNTDLAETDFNRMLALNPDGLYPRMGLASLAKFRGDYDDAEKIYNYLIEKEPELPGLYAGRAEVYLLANKPGKASADATRALRLYGAAYHEPYPYIIRCKAKLLLREKKAALEDLEKAVALGYDAKAAAEIRKAASD
jgi:tetratricopeptide (TPR) repeat protein